MTLPLVHALRSINIDYGCGQEEYWLCAVDSREMWLVQARTSATITSARVISLAAPTTSPLIPRTAFGHYEEDCGTHNHDHTCSYQLKGSYRKEHKGKAQKKR